MNYDQLDLKSKIILSRAMKPGLKQVSLTRLIEKQYENLSLASLEMSEGLGERSKPKCISGTACGYACISGKKRCSDKISARDAAELLKSVGASSLPSTKSLSDLASVLHLLGESAFEQTDKAYKDSVDSVLAWQSKHSFEKSDSIALYKHDKIHIDLHILVGEDSDGIRKKYGFTGELSTAKYSSKSGPTVAEETAIQIIEDLANNHRMTYKYGTMSVYNDFKTNPTAFAKDLVSKVIDMVADDKDERDRTSKFVVDFAEALAKHSQLDKILERQVWLLKKAKETGL